jgi:ribose transport system permease protein
MTATHAGTERQTGRFLLLAERLGLAAIFAITVIGFALAAPDTFPTSGNWSAIVSSQSVTAVIAVALVVTLTAGNFDLSVGSVAVLCSIVAAGLMSRSGLALVPASAVVLAIALAIGLLNGVLVAYARLDSLIVTLGTSTVIGGVISLYSDDLAVAEGVSSKLLDFGTAETLGLPRIALASLVIVGACWWVLSETPLGRRLTAIGSNSRAAELAGVRVRRLTLVTFLWSGGLAGLAGILLLAQQGTGNPAISGIAFMLPALAAAFLGASAFTPGQFNVPGTILALLLVASIVSGLTLLDADTWVEPVVNGAALIIAVGVSTAFRRQRLGAAG